jgi:hypothetical protein
VAGREDPRARRPAVENAVIRLVARGVAMILKKAQKPATSVSSRLSSVGNGTKARALDAHDDGDPR